MDCPWYSWLWHCATNGSDSTWWSDGLGPGNVSYPKAILYGTVGAIGLTLNVLALTGLHKCSLTYSTLLLMKLQCSMNAIGLLAITVCGPVALVIGQPFPLYSWGRLVFQIPGGMLVLAIYGQFALQGMMAINRFVAICYRNKAQFWFSDNRSLIYSSICVLHGSWNFLMCIFPCCPCYFDHITHKWGYHHGWGAGIRKPMTITSDFVCCTIMIYCYARTFRKIRQLGSQMSNAEMSRKELKRERKVFYQFFAIACTWLGYSICYRPVYYIEAINNLPVTLMISELIRFWMFTVDPVIYFIFMKSLRAHVLYTLSCGRIITEGVTDWSTSDRRHSNALSSRRKVSTNIIAMSMKRVADAQSRVGSATNTVPSAKPRAGSAVSRPTSAKTPAIVVQPVSSK